MWSTIANFKDNLTQIASEVLDTTDDQKGGGSEDEFEELYNSQHSSSTQKNSDLKAELDWYRAELPRLQAAESELHSVSSKYETLLKEREDALLRLREENGVLKEKYVALASERSSQNHVARGEAKQMREKLEKLELKIRKDEDLHQKRVTELQEHHEKSREDLITQYKVELANAKALHESSVSLAENNTQPNSNGPLSQDLHEKILRDLNLEVLQLQQNKEELSHKLTEKDEVYEKLRTAYDRSLSEGRKLKEEVSKSLEDSLQKDLQLKRDREAADASGREFESLRLENLKISEEMGELQKISNERDNIINRFELIISTLEKSNAELQEEKNALSTELLDRSSAQTAEIYSERDSLALKEALAEVDRLSVQVKDAEEACVSQKDKFEKLLGKVTSERDKAVRDLARLKQHLLDKERADSEKMDQDNEEMADLAARADANLFRALQAEKELSIALNDVREARRFSTDELSKAKEEIVLLHQKLGSCMTALESKDVELSNLQSALGQYYAESEAQDRFYLELSAVKEECSKLSELLQTANQMIELKSEEQNSALEKITLTEQRVLEKQQKIQKLEDEIVRLRRALEQSMTRLNSLSSDSDNNVDRRIVIKLLVTYFQRNHSKEVLDLMVRMLGFSEEDKRRVGLAQQAAGRGVVRGVLGLPGRFVGGIIGSASSDSLSHPAPSDDKSFADLWIDFLLKESEERERREKAEANGKVEQGIGKDSLKSGGYVSSVSARGSVSTPQSPSYSNHKPSGSFSSFSTSLASPKDHPYQDPTTTVPGSANGKVSVSQSGDVAGTEFSSIPLNTSSLNSAASNSHLKLPPRF